MRFNLIASFLLATGTGFPAHEIVRSGSDKLVCATNASFEGRESKLLVDHTLGEQPTERLPVTPAAQVKRHGPLSWGIRDEAYYVVGHTEVVGTTIVCFTQSLDDRISVERGVRESNNLDREALSRAHMHDATHGRRVGALSALLRELEQSGIPRLFLGVHFDLAYTASNHVTVIAVRQGQLRWWTWNKPEETDWVDRGEMETRLEGAFRIVQAGDDLYLVDSRGWVFSSPGRGARLLGTIAGWGQPREGETLFLLEEQKHGKIAVVKVAEGETTVLEALVEAEAREDFMTVIDNEDLNRAIIRMAAALREEEQGGK